MKREDVGPLTASGEPIATADAVETHTIQSAPDEGPPPTLGGAAPQLDEQNLVAVDDPAGETPSPRLPLLRTDTLAQSLAALVVLAVAQRVVGFGRSVLVCGWLSPDQLGEWDLANRFFVLAAPLVVLGLPGSFGRYLEHYRQRGALRSVLLRTIAICSVLAVVAVMILLWAPEFIAQQVFGRVDRASSIAMLAVGLIGVIAYNYLTETLTALRLVRVSSLVQFLNSIAFALLCVVLLGLWQLDAMAIVLAYASSCLLLVFAAAVWLATHWSRLPRDRHHIPHREMWRKLVPFAVWVWVTNLLFNVFEVVDRYLVLHVGNLPDVQALLGQYHSAQVIPVLIVSVAGLLAGMILPHLSRDWESGERGRVSDTLNLTVKLLSVAMFAGSVVVLFAAPLLFDVAWRGKYAEGQALLPLTLASCSWLGLSTVAQMYLWCAERARLGCAALAIGLGTNVALNLAWIPIYGLPGAVAATTLSHLAVLAMVLAINRSLQMRVQPATVVLTLLPAALLLGPWIALLVLAVTAFGLLADRRLLTQQESERMASVWRGYRSRFRSGKVD